jgi:hypothetical protein
MIDPEKLLNNKYQVKTRNELIGIWMMVLLSHYKQRDDGSTEEIIHNLKVSSDHYTDDTLVDAIKRLAPRISELIEFDPSLYLDPSEILETAPAI